jgi:hypothetical protein
MRRTGHEGRLDEVPGGFMRRKREQKKGAAVAAPLLMRRF